MLMTLPVSVGLMTADSLLVLYWPAKAESKAGEGRAWVRLCSFAS